MHTVCAVVVRGALYWCVSSHARLYRLLLVRAVVPGALRYDADSLFDLMGAHVRFSI